MSSVVHSDSQVEVTSETIMELVSDMSKELCETSKSGGMYPRSINKIDNEERIWIMNTLMKKYDRDVSMKLTDLVFKTSLEICPRSF